MEQHARLSQKTNYLGKVTQDTLRLSEWAVVSWKRKYLGSVETKNW